jgi:hypothetical protein
MPDAIQTFSSDYIYISDRLVADIVDQVEAAATKQKLSKFQLKLPFLSIETRDRDLGDNRYALAVEATEAVMDLTGTLAHPGPFVLAEATLTWWDIYVDHGQYRVAWLVAEESGEDGRYLFTMCGSLDHYLGYDATKTKQQGWRPSTLEGMRDIVAAYHRQPRKFNADPPDTNASIEKLVLEASHVSLLLNPETDGPLGVAKMQLLARVWQGMYGSIKVFNYRTSKTELFDGLFVGTPLWVRTPPIQAAVRGMRVITAQRPAG